MGEMVDEAQIVLYTHYNCYNLQQGKGEDLVLMRTYRSGTDPPIHNWWEHKTVLVTVENRWVVTQKVKRRVTL